MAILAVHPLTGGHTYVQTGRPLIKFWLLARLAIVLSLASWFLRVRGLNWADLGLCKPVWWRFAAAIPLGLVVGFTIVTGVNIGLRKAGVHSSDFTAFAGIHDNLAEYLFWGFAVAWGAAGIGEELIFRGFAMNALQRIAGPAARGATTVAIVGQALLFGGMHLYQGLGGAVTTSVVGLVLGLVWLGSGRNLWAGIVTHGLIDCSSITAIYLNGISH